MARSKLSQFCLLAISLITPLRGATQKPQAFEVVAISHHPLMQPGAPIQIDASQLRVFGSGLLELISYAYGVEQYRVTGPDWFMKERYDIWARVPEGSKKQDIPT